MRRLLIVCLTSVMLIGCKEQKPVIDLTTTTFPSEAIGDYQPNGYLARVVFPHVSREGQDVWVKGNESLTRVRIQGNSRWTELSPPFYTAHLTTQADSAFVEFAAEEQQPVPDQGVWVYPVKKSTMTDTTAFSFNVFGCFQPFDVDKDTDKAVVRRTEDNTDASIRNLFALVGTNQKMTYYDRAEKEGGNFFEINVKDEKEGAEQQYGELVAPPTLLIATGDQVYVDAAYDSAKEKNPISGWEVGENPQARLQPKAFEGHLNRLYRHFFSFTTMESVTARLPVIAGWDDHEIRDGWGSQGDEYPDSLQGFEHIEPHVKPYFMAARQAYIEHQLATAPVPPTPLDDAQGSDLHLELEANGIPVFVFDLRSQRNLKMETVVDNVQLRAFEHWLENTEQDQEIVIVNSVPFFWRTTSLFQELLKIKPELRDDIADAWDVKHNVAQRDAILKALLTARMKKNIKPFICSGDIHVAALNEVWYQENHEEEGEAERKLLAYELITSGLSHKGLANQTYAGQLQKLASDEGAFINDLALVDYPDRTYDFTVRMLLSAAKLNFANIEHAAGQTNINIFLQDKEKLMQMRFPIDWNKVYENNGFKVNELTDDAQAKTYIAKDSGIKQRVILQ